MARRRPRLVLALRSTDFYRGSDLVRRVTLRNFHGVVERARQPVVAEFYADWCVHCQEMVGEYKKASVGTPTESKVFTLEEDF